MDVGRAFWRLLEMFRAEMTVARAKTIAGGMEMSGQIQMRFRT